jgi:hypothetical protein
MLIGATRASLLLALCWPLLAQNLRAQEEPGHKAPSITMLSAARTSIRPGQPGSVELRFKVAEGFHVNSNKPSEEYLIPTALTLDAPTDIVIGKITYPPGKDVSFAFAPDQKLNVYSGDFAVSVLVRPLTKVLPGDYAVHGQLKYQACDNAACYPPKKLPVDFQVKVVKAPPPRRKNPGQSPHVHG